MRKHLGIVVALAVLTTGSAVAQFDTNGPNATLDINGLTASVVDPANHQIALTVPGVMDLNIGSGANTGQGIIMLLGPTNANTFPVPWGGSLDVGVAAIPLPTNITLLFDGIGMTANAFLDPYAHTDTAGAFTLTLGLPASLSGAAGVGWQAIVQDPSNGGFDNTEVAEPTYIAGNLLTLQTGDDLTVAVPFSNGASFNFYGVNYTEVYVNSNGAASFGGTLAFPGSFYAPNTLGQIGDFPHISANWADWDITQGGAFPNDGLLYLETNNKVEITWGGSLGSFGSSQNGLSHFGDVDSGMFKLTLELDDGLGGNPSEGLIEIEYTTLDPTAALNNDAVIGIVAGGGMGTMNVNQDFHQVVIGGPNDTLLEEHDTAGALPPNNIGWDGLGTPHCYHNGNKWNGQTLQFLPLTNITTGDLGYVGQEKNFTPRPDDALSLNLSTGSDNGGTPVTICGWFANFDAVSSVVFDPGGLALQAVVLGVLDNTSTHPLATPNTTNPEYRDNEGLSILTPGPGGLANPLTVDVEINFSNGSTFTLTNAWTWSPSGITLTTYDHTNIGGLFTGPSADDGAVQHFLAPNGTTSSGFNEITYGGVVYTDIFIGTNGYVSFNAGSGDFTPTAPEFFAGWQNSPTTTPVPGVAVVWGDFGRVSVTTDSILVTEDANLQTVKIEYLNQEHWDSLLPAGNFSVEFGAPLGAGSLQLDHSAFLQGANGTDQPPIIGVTDGDDQVGTDVGDAVGGASAFDLTANQGTYTSGGQESIMEQFDYGANPVDLGASPLIFFDIGGGGTFYIWSIL